MEKKKTQRQLRHEARLARQRQQRLRISAIVFVVVVILGAIVAANVIRTNQAEANATATTVAQQATNTAVALNPAAVTPASSADAVATITAFGATVNPMTFIEPPADLVKTPSGLQYKDLVNGNGTEAQTGDHVYVHYTGWLTDGTSFDSSVTRGTPFDFNLGAGRVIEGWDEGVAGMKVGGRRLLVIPPELGYGASANGSIPANSTLVFEVALLGVTD